MDSLSVQSETAAQRSESFAHMNEITKNNPIINHVDRSHVTTPDHIFDLGPVFGKVGFSSTVHDSSNEAALFYSFVDVGNDMNLYGGGINIFGILGMEVGGNSNYNAFVNLQVSPWVHGTLSIGANGVGAIVGIDSDNTSHDFEIYAGWGTIGFLFGSYVFLNGYNPSFPQTAPAR